MKLQVRTLVAAAAVCALFVGSTQAQSTIAEWNFNGETGPTNVTTGAGTLSGAFLSLGFGTPVAASTGSPGDPNPVAFTGGGLNNRAAGRSAPNAGEANGAAGNRNLTISVDTSGYEDITFSWDVLQGYRASRFHQIFATTDGTTFNPVVGVGSSASVLGSSTNAPNGNPQTVMSASVDNSGIVDIRTSDNMIPDPATGDAFIQDLTFTFPNGMGYDNNPNFAIKIGSSMDAAAGDYVSSFAGTTASDTVSGFSRVTSEGGGNLYDMINISGSVVPEPAGMLPLAAAGLLLLGLGRRRRS